MTNSRLSASERQARLLTPEKADQDETPIRRRRNINGADAEDRGRSASLSASEQQARALDRS